MNRSRWCATVVAITAGVLFAGVGMAAPAGADPAADRAGSMADGQPGGRGDSDVAAPDGARTPATAPGRPRGRGTAGPAPAPAPAAVDEPAHWPCPWLVIRPVVPPEPETARNNGFIPIPPAMASPTVPTAQISGGVERSVPGLYPAPSYEPAAPQPPAVLPAPVPHPTAVSAAPRSRAPVASPSAARSAARPVPLSGPGPARVPQLSSPAEPPESVRLGYPEELRNADVATVAALALPGLAAIAGMTALGAFFGYRQARAGFVLRAAGAGRFQQ